MNILHFLSPLQDLLKTFQKERHYQNEKKELALIAIQNALIETKKHLALTSENRGNEFYLANLWADASAKIRFYSSDLASRLNDKSKYWQDEFVWSKDIILDKKIDFESIEKEIDYLLKE